MEAIRIVTMAFTPQFDHESKTPTRVKIAELQKALPKYEIKINPKK